MAAYLSIFVAVWVLSIFETGEREEGHWGEKRRLLLCGWLPFFSSGLFSCSIPPLCVASFVPSLVTLFFFGVVSCRVACLVAFYFTQPTPCLAFGVCAGCKFCSWGRERGQCRQLRQIKKSIN
ncbi:hypothetical protein HDK77DRAFT_453884 [Phyllosticta capitalensis]